MSFYYGDYDLSDEAKNDKAREKYLNKIERQNRTLGRLEDTWEFQARLRELREKYLQPDYEAEKAAKEKRERRKRRNQFNWRNEL